MKHGRCCPSPLPGQYCPDGPGEFVSYRSDRDVEGAPFEQFVEPGSSCTSSDHGSGTVYEQGAEIGVPTFAYP